MATLTPEELTKLQDFQQHLNQNTFDLGEITVKKHNLNEQLMILDKEKSNLIQILITLSKQQEEFLKIIETKYGSGTIDINTGEIN